MMVSVLSRLTNPTRARDRWFFTFAVAMVVVFSWDLTASGNPFKAYLARPARVSDYLEVPANEGLPWKAKRGPYSPSVVFGTLDSVDRPTLYAVFYPSRSSLPGITSHTFVPHRVPTIIYSHGTGLNWARHRAFAEIWASHGYLVILPNHAGSDDGYLRPNDRKHNFGLLQGAITYGPTTTNRLSDINDVYDLLPRLSEWVGDDRVPEVDMERVAVGGYSMGAHTALLSALSYPDRYQAVLAISPPSFSSKFRPEGGWSKLVTPLLSFSGTEDVIRFLEDDIPDRRIEPYLEAAAPIKAHVLIEGANHFHFVKNEQNGEQMLAHSISETVAGAALLFWDSILWERGDMRTLVELGESKAGMSVMMQGASALVKNEGPIMRHRDAANLCIRLLGGVNPRHGNR